MTSLLEVDRLVAGYDRADVLSGVSLTVRRGTVTCILGANGAGKTTLIRTILGLTRARAGTILFEGTDLTRMRTHRIAAQGIGCIPEGRRVFPKMTVEENLRAGAYLERQGSVTAQRLRRVYEIFPRLKEREGQFAGTMSGGEQAMLSIGRGLMAGPKLLLIDEPSLGLSPLYVKESFKVISRIREMGISVLLVEQNVRQTLNIADEGYVLSQGRVVAHGDAAHLRTCDEVGRAYFGSPEAGP